MVDQQTLNSVPKRKVGGTGPWPDTVDDVVVGDSYDREIPAGDGSTTMATVTVDEIVEFATSEGAGYAVTYTHPAPGGGN